MIWSLLWRSLFHLENILMAGETGDVRKLFSNSAKSWFFGCFFWTLIANGTVIYLVHIFLSAFYHMQLKEANRYFNILLEISLARSTSSFGIFSIFSQSMAAVLLFFPLIRQHRLPYSADFNSFPHCFSSLHLLPRPKADATCFIFWYNTPSRCTLLCIAQHLLCNRLHQT